MKNFNKYYKLPIKYEYHKEYSEEDHSIGLRFPCIVNRCILYPVCRNKKEIDCEKIYGIIRSIADMKSINKGLNQIKRLFPKVEHILLPYTVDVHYIYKKLNRNTVDVHYIYKKLNKEISNDGK